MEFLVQMDTTLPSGLADDERAALLAREAERGRQLRESGMLRQIWRVPGRLANVAIWSAPTATELHQALASLPAWRYADITVTPLADHPLGTGLP